MRTAVTAITRDDFDADSAALTWSRGVITVLCTRRKELRLSAETLSKRSGVTRVLIGQLEDGRAVLTVPVMSKLAMALDWDAGEMIAALEAAVFGGGE